MHLAAQTQQQAELEEARAVVRHTKRRITATPTRQGLRRSQLWGLRQCAGTTRIEKASVTDARRAQTGRWRNAAALLGGVHLTESRLISRGQPAPGRRSNAAYRARTQPHASDLVQLAAPGAGRPLRPEPLQHREPWERPRPRSRPANGRAALAPMPRQPWQDSQVPAARDAYVGDHIPQAAGFPQVPQHR